MARPAAPPHTVLAEAGLAPAVAVVAAHVLVAVVAAHVAVAVAVAAVAAVVAGAVVEMEHST